MDAPCAICGNIEMKLVDGFYYCIECGTQDTNVCETVVERTMLADGTVQVGTTRKIQTVTDEGIIMTGEWYKWHAFNFILLGLVDELISLGAKPTFKMKVLWVWTRYIKKFQNKEDLRNTSSTFLYEEENTDKKKNSDSDSSLDRPLDVIKIPKKSKMKTKENSNGNIQNITTNLLLSILYVALNLDKSDIQLSHLFQFLREGKLSLLNWAKFIPKDIKIKRIPDWIRFERCNKECSRKLIHENSINLMRVLNLGAPILPDLNKIVNNFIKELCLPNDFRDLVFSLMNLVPCDFLILCSNDTKCLKRIPDYEVTVMGYVLIAMKMCFGLDDEYEIKLSDAVDHVNESEDNYLKSYKLGKYSCASDRLFSFRDWSKYLQLRKMILSRYYLPIAWQNNTEADDYVLIEQSTRSKGKKRVSDEITMDILNKLSHTEDGSVIPKSEFVPTLTPMTTYKEVILQYFQDPEQKLILSEDFSQYSLKYAITDLNFPPKYENLKEVIIGVNDNNKIKNKDIIGTLVTKKFNFTEVYVRNCENKNWLKTKPPMVKHVKDVDNESDSDTDHGYDSPKDADGSRAVETNNESDNTLIEFEDKDNTKLELITEEKEGQSIFDDTFENIKEEKTIFDSTAPFEFNETVTSDLNLYNDDYNDIKDSKSDICSSGTSKKEYDPNNFNRSNTIKALIIKACKDLKVPIPKEYRDTVPKETRKRQASNNNQVTDEATQPKRTRMKRGEAKQEVNDILSTYYSRVENHLLNQISTQLANTINENNILDTLNNINPPHSVEPAYQSDIGNTTEELGNVTNSVHNIESNSIIGNSISCVMEGSEAEEETEAIPKDDPRYDEKTHDIKQLYVKIIDNQNTDTIDPYFFKDDPDMLKIIEQQMEKIRQGTIENTRTDNKEITKIDGSDSDSDYEKPLKVVQQQMKIELQNLKKKTQNLESLVKRKNHIGYNYWLRHYTTDNFSKCLRMNTKFDIELQENFPKSFVFVIQECASIINCQAFVLYKILQSLEQMLVRIK